MKNRNLIHSDNWETPIELYNKLNEEFKFDFDPCPISHEEITPDKDGLLIPWGKSNFVNPPYSRKLKEDFIKRSVYEYCKGKTVVLLLPVSTSTHIFHEYIYKSATEIKFIKGRVKFNGITTTGEKSTGAGMHDSMIVIFDAKKIISFDSHEPTIKSFEQ